MEDRLCGTYDDGSTAFQAQKVFSKNSVNASEGCWLSTGPHHAGLIVHNNLAALIAFWLCQEPKLVRIDGHIDGRAVMAYPDQVVHESKADLVIQFLLRDMEGN